MSTDATLSFEEAMEKYDPVLGFEVHVELNTKTKMFSSAPNVFGDEPNTNVNEVDLGMPGVLPVVNKTAIESSIKIGLALNCKIAETCTLCPEAVLLPGHPQELPDLPVRRARSPTTATWTSNSPTAPCSASRSSAPTWKRTPAS